MFGDKAINGETKLVVRPTGQIVLPAFTYAEANDKVGLMFGLGRVDPQLTIKDNLQRTRIVIMQLQEFEEKIAFLYNHIKTLKEMGKLDYTQYHNWQRVVSAMLAISNETVSSLKRIKIPQFALDKLKISDSVYAVGEERRLILYPNKEQYLSTKRNID